MKSRSSGKIVALLLLALVAAAVALRWRAAKRRPAVSTATVIVTNGTIRASVIAAGTVEPRHRLELTPTVNGRVEKVLVKEGDVVKAGSVLAWISSAERAALLDTAKVESSKEEAYWEAVYKPAPLIAPMDGQIIQRRIGPGQTVTLGTPILVLSDRLVVRLHIDETDIGKVSVGRPAEITLDAYPDVKTIGAIDHISYESERINNVTMYGAVIGLSKVPAMFKSGMSAQVRILEREVVNVPVVPMTALRADAQGYYVWVKNDAGEAEVRRVTLGLRSEECAQITAGVSVGDAVMAEGGSSESLGQNAPTNPFLPLGNKNNRGALR